MASTKFIVMLAIISMFSISIVTAIEHIVGDETGWTGNFDYQAWAKDKMFYLGDTLVFKYTAPNHDVYKVNGTNFKDCVVPAGLQALATGYDVVPLKTPGKKWYICGKPNHCAGLGLKLAITVLDGTAPASAPTTNSAPAIFTQWFQVFVSGLVAVGAMIAA